MLYHLKVDGESYEFDDSKLSVAEAMLIKEKTGLGVIQWGRGLSDGDPHSLMALVLLAKKRSGEAAKWADMQHLDVMDLVMQVMRSLAAAIDALDDEDEDEAGSDPTEPAKAPAKKKSTAGRTRKPESSAT